MIKGFVSLYLPSYATTIVYMLQSTEYQVGPYLRWYWRTKDFSEVTQRRSLEYTKAARLLLLALRFGIAAQIVAGLTLMYLGLWQDVIGATPFGAALIIGTPVVWAHLVVLPLIAGRILITKPAEARAIRDSEQRFAEHNGIKIAVAGSYGKTTMKELLATVLSEGKKVAATPANKNVSISHANFAKKLDGYEDVLIIEYGEGAPGDVARFASITHPTHAVITGLAPAHLDQYKTLQAAGEDIFSVADQVPAEHVYVNTDAPSVTPFVKPEYRSFNEQGALGWSVHDVSVSLSGTKFSLKKGKQTLKLQSQLIGHHQIGFLAFVAAFARHIGLADKQIQAGVAQTKPFEHRMQPYPLAGAWIIDDTYNGNLEGIRAGTRLLSELSASRKIYITPGLVEQGEETERVHLEVGTLIAGAEPDLVVLMKNSATVYIQKGLDDAGYKGEVRIESHPLEFYTNLKHFVASGDLVVMQNDWTDNYH